MKQKRRLVLGGPGAGKTTRLIAIVKDALDRGVPPDQIAFVAFTKAGAEEAANRTGSHLGLSGDDLLYFRTIHSFCFYELGMAKADVFGKDRLEEFGDVVGEQLTGAVGEDSPAKRVGDILMTAVNYARTAMIPLAQAHRELDQDVDWFRLKRFADAYKIFREDRGLYDFTDMLERYVREGRRAPVKVAIVDEGQDLSALQWAVVEKAFAGAEEVWIAGDDDQSIYRWSGADEARFLALDYEREVLEVSHRLPAAVFDFSQGIIRRVEKRFAKQVRPGRPGGKVDWVSRADEADYGSGTWLLLARTRSQLPELEAVLREQGVVYKLRSNSSSVDQDHVRAIVAHEDMRKGWRVEGVDAVLAMRAAGYKTADVDETLAYTAEELKYDTSRIWHDALIRIPLETREYYLACRRRGESLQEEPRVRVDTIHGSKGAEAENVLMVTDMTYRVQQGYERDPDAEHRVFYVGATRARETLTLVAPQTAYGYQI